MNIRDIFKIILNNPYGSIFITDAKGDVVFVNLGAENLLGKKRRDLLGANVRTLLQETFIINRLSWSAFLIKKL